MAKKRGGDFDLDRAIRDPGFTPKRSDAGALLDRMASGSDEEKLAERAVIKLGVAILDDAAARARDRSFEGRPAILRCLGRVAASANDEDAAPIVALAIELLGDEDARVRRAAATTIAKARARRAPDQEAERALSAAIAIERDASASRAMIEALGRTGAKAAAELLASHTDASAERTRAAIVVRRAMARAEPSTIDLDVDPTSPLTVALRCRSGLASIVIDELPASPAPKLASDPLAGDRVEVTITRAPSSLFASRVALSMGFLLAPVRAAPSLAEAVASSLASDEARAIIRRFTRGPLRYRLAWSAGGKRRAEVWRAAELTSRLAPELVNDPQDSPWEVIVHEASEMIRVELVPSAVDPRFRYRVADVPAASHPTLAAALVRIAGSSPNDVVWDPFVGSGLELCERAIAGPYAALIGTDREPSALEAARKNLDAVSVGGVGGARDATLVAADATLWRPSGSAPTLVISNPPMGRRIERTRDLGPMLTRALANVHRALAPGGRIVWISPLPELTRGEAERLHLVMKKALTVDMGGFSAEIQVLDKPKPRAASARRRLD